MIMNIIFFATMYPIVFIMLFLFSTQNKYENGLLVLDKHEKRMDEKNLPPSAASGKNSKKEYCTQFCCD